MMPDLRKIDNLSARIHDLIAKTRRNDLAENIEMKAALASHICVLLSGLIEVSVQTVCAEHCFNKSEKRVADYVSSQLGLFRNPKWDRILHLLEQFDPRWRLAIETQCSDEIKSAIDSVVNNRNRIAHGDQVQVSLVAIDAYTKSVMQFVTTLREVVFSQIALLAQERPGAPS